MRTLPLAAMLVMALLGAQAPARAAVLPVRQTGIDLVAGRMCASVGLQDLFTDADRQRIKSGFATRVLIRIALYREGLSEPIARTYLRSEIVYDIWDEKFRVRSTSPEFADLRAEVTSLDDAVLRATSLRRFPVVPVALLGAEAQYYLAFRADLNPVSEQEMADVRRWLASPSQGASRRVGPGDSLFGSLVSIFVNPRIEDSERQLRFMSQTFNEPRRRAP